MDRDFSMRKFRIFKNEFPKRDGTGMFTKYSTKISKKVVLSDGSEDWANKFITVEFRIKGGVNIIKGTDIEVPADKWNLSFNEWYSDDGEKHEEWIIVIYDFNIVKVPQNDGINAQNDGIEFNGNSYPQGQNNPPQGNYGANRGYSAPQQNPAPAQNAFGGFNDVPQGFNAAEDDIPF